MFVLSDCGIGEATEWLRASSSSADRVTTADWETRASATR